MAISIAAADENSEPTADSLVVSKTWSSSGRQQVMSQQHRLDPKVHCSVQVIFPQRWDHAYHRPNVTSEFPGEECAITVTANRASVSVDHPKSK